MAPNAPRSPLGAARLLILGLVVVILVAGLALIVGAITGPNTASARGQVDALAASSDTCVTCHRRTTPGIVQQYGYSTMAASNVRCQDCHQVAAGFPAAIEHFGVYVLSEPTPANCGLCHSSELAQFSQSRHGLPAYAAMVGKDKLDARLTVVYQSIPEAVAGPVSVRNALYAIEGPDITPFACETCHNIGSPNADGSVGDCTTCHLRHEFSLEQVRKPETCNNCHIGPDHPQWEIYHESPHGIKYSTGGERWNWDALPGTLTVKDFPAPTCAICHISGFGGQSTTHDVGERLTWFSFGQISERRPAWQANMGRMQSVCGECHNRKFVTNLYEKADKAVAAVNTQVQAADALMAALKAEGLLTDEPFDEPIDFTHFELWHHWGRTTKFGVWMQGADYTQWHGAYEMLHSAAELKVEAEDKRSAAAR